MPIPQTPLTIIYHFETLSCDDRRKDYYFQWMNHRENGISLKAA